MVFRDGMGQPEHDQHLAVDHRGRARVADDAGQSAERQRDHRDELLRRRHAHQQVGGAVILHLRQGAGRGGMMPARVQTTERGAHGRDC